MLVPVNTPPERELTAHIIEQPHRLFEHLSSYRQAMRCGIAIDTDTWRSLLMAGKENMYAISIEKGILRFDRPGIFGEVISVACELFVTPEGLLFLAKPEGRRLSNIFSVNLLIHSSPLNHVR